MWFPVCVCVCRYDGNKDQFATDARQVFSNCAYYNEDKSEVSVYCW